MFVMATVNHVRFVKAIAGFIAITIKKNLLKKSILFELF